MTLMLAEFGQLLCTRQYGYCSQISNIFLFLFANKILVFRVPINKMQIGIANREDPDQIASGFALFF